MIIETNDPDLMMKMKQTYYNNCLVMVDSDKDDELTKDNNEVVEFFKYDQFQYDKIKSMEHTMK